MILSSIASLFCYIFGTLNFFSTRKHWKTNQIIPNARDRNLHIRKTAAYIAAGLAFSGITAFILFSL